MGWNSHWIKAFGISCVLHIAALTGVGLLAGLPHQPLEEYMMIDLTLPYRVEEPGGATAGSAGGSQLTPAGEARQGPAAQSAPSRTDPVHKQADANRGDRGVAAPAGIQSIDDGVGTTAVSGAGDGIGSGSGTSGGYGDGGGTGAGNGGSGTGIGTGSGSGSGIDSIIGAFLSELENRKVYPYIARKRSQEGTVILMVELGTTGNLADIRVMRPSGFAKLDEAAVELVRRICPFPHNLGRPIAMKIPISYQLRE